MKEVLNLHRCWLALVSAPLEILTGVIRKGWLLALAIPSPVRFAVRLLNDYGNTARYAAENQQLHLAPEGGRVVFMGDSITDFWGRGQFAARAPFFIGKPYVNRGISGQVTAQMLV